ncbi:MAG: tetratricopeptide repeat protein [Nitrospirota bacterium]
MEEMIIGFLLSIFTNGIITLADRYDSEQKKKFEELSKELRESNFIPKAIVDSLKSISVESKEIDSLKILVSDDVFSKKLADIISNQSPENDTINLIVSEIKKYCNIPESQILTIEPFIKIFANEFYKKVLSNPKLSPYLIIKRIEDSIKMSENDHLEIKERIESLHKKFNTITSQVPKENPTTYTASVQSYETERLIIAANKINKTDELPRVTHLLTGQLERVLAKLNSHFKSRANEVKEIQRKRDFKRAIELYQSLLEDADETIDKDTILGIYADCALCSINLDDLESARMWLRKAEETETIDKRILAIWSLYYYALGNKTKAQEYADKSLALDKFYHLALIIKAGIELESGTNGERILNQYFLDENGNVRSGFKQDRMPVIYRTIGQCYMKDKNFDKAIEYFEKSINLDPLDDGCLSLIGTAYFRKTIGESTQIIRFHEQLSPEKQEIIKKAIGYFTQALESAARYGNIKHHIPTRVNLSSCYMLLGDYDKAYDISEISLVSAGYEDLLKSKAAAAYYKGHFTEAAELLSNIKKSSCQDIINEALSLLRSDKKQEALELIDSSLHEKSFNSEDLDLIRHLRLEILISDKDQENALRELKKLEYSTLPVWQKETIWGDYYVLVNNHEKADEYYKKALEHSNTAIPTKISIADYYFRKEDYKTCFDICSSISIDAIKSDLDIFKRLIQMAIISSFQIPNCIECRKYINHGKRKEIEDLYLYEISASIYWQNDELKKARDELIILEKKDTNRKLEVLSNLGVVSYMMGDFKAAQEYLTQAERLSGFYDNTKLVINCIIVHVVIGNNVEAKRISNKALEEKFEDKEDDIHKFAPVFYLRENNTELFARYAIEFNKKHGDTEWLWKKYIKKDEQELRAIFSEAIRKSEEIKKGYLKYPLPLALLPALLGKREVIHLWRFNREYKYPIFLESGIPQELESEIKTISKKRSILVDYTALLTLQEAGPDYLWIIHNSFDEIFIYRPMYLRMLNELMSEEHDGLRRIINFISASNKVKFIKRVTNKTLNIPDESLSLLIPGDYYGLLQVAREKEICLLIGEARLRGIVRSIGIEACGIRSLLEHAKHKNIIDNHNLNQAIINMATKDCQFISFNNDTLEWLFSRYSLEKVKSKFKKLSDHIFLPGSEVETFTNVYSEFIREFIGSILDSQIIKYFIEKTILDIKKLTSRALCFNMFPFLKQDGVLTDMYKINQICLGYIYRLVLLIYSSMIDERLKSEYIEVVKREFNLAYWYKLKIQNKNAIGFIFEEVKKQIQVFDTNNLAKDSSAL